MSELEGLSEHTGEERSGMDAHFFIEEQLLYLENDDKGEEEHVEDVELEVIEVAM